MKTSKDFPLNARVKMTPGAIALKFHGKHNRRTGVVRARLSPEIIRVKRDGDQVAESYSVEFWELMPRNCDYENPIFYPLDTLLPRSRR